jgi:hypothetical protein
MGNWFSDTWKDLTQPGWRQADDANKLNEQAISQQAGTEAFRQKQATDLEDLANSFLFGNVEKGITGSLAPGQDWVQNYLNFLKTSPDVTYNQERSALERGVKGAREASTLSAMRRGMGAGGALDRINLERTKGLSRLAGDRVDTYCRPSRGDRPSKRGRNVFRCIEPAIIRPAHSAANELTDIASN